MDTRGDALDKYTALGKKYITQNNVLSTNPLFETEHYNMATVRIFIRIYSQR